MPALPDLHVKWGKEKYGIFPRYEPDEHWLGLSEKPRKLVSTICHGCVRVRLELDDEAIFRIAISVCIAAKKCGDGIESNIFGSRYIRYGCDALKQQ